MGRSSSEEPREPGTDSRFRAGSRFAQHRSLTSEYDASSGLASSASTLRAQVRARPGKRARFTDTWKRRVPSADEAEGGLKPLSAPSLGDGEGSPPPTRRRAG